MAIFKNPLTLVTCRCSLAWILAVRLRYGIVFRLSNSLFGDGLVRAVARAHVYESTELFLGGFLRGAIFWVAARTGSWLPGYSSYTSH